MSFRAFQFSTSSIRRALRVAALAACGLVAAAPAHASVHSVKYVPVYVPLVVIHARPLHLFKAGPKDLGYLPALGNAALRWIDPAPAPRAIEPPPIVLYNPVPETPATATGDTKAPKNPDAVPSQDSDPSHAAAQTPQGGKALRAEDFLPFFESPGELRGARGDVDGSTFVPARPVLPESRADYRQK